uniref:Uncharacterized protein n=1 Tax=viral metagenome TaxID=1070528 RepID=A0A6C0K4G4_9ZZZZ
MQISLFLLISIVSLSTGGKIINKHLDRLLQGSANYGSGPNYGSVVKKSYASYGSGVESKYSTAGSNAKHWSTNVEHGSYKQYSRASHNYVFSGNIGSGKKKHHSYAIKGSGSTGGSSSSRNNHYSYAVKGSGAYSGTKGGSGSNGPYDIFAPTMRPTEALPPIYQPPPPTHYPTSYKSIPVVPITFNQPTIEGIEVPEIPLSFQIEQGANGWAQYPSDSHPLEKAFTNVVAKTAGIVESSVSDMKIKKTQRRVLSTSFIVSYYITTTPALNGEKTQLETYYKIANKLTLSINNNNFSSELYCLGVKLNVSSITFSNYAVIYPTLSPTSAINVLSSAGASDQSPLTDSISIGVGILIAIGVLCAFVSFYLKSKRDQKINREISIIEIPQHIEKVRNPMTDIIPDPLRRIAITHTQMPSE